MTQPAFGQRAYWNGPAGAEWVRKQALLDDMLAPMTPATVEALGDIAGRSVLDVGCGSGATTMMLAAAAGLQGVALGADISEPLIAYAKQRAREENSTARFVIADAGADFLPDTPYDALFSRFGVMFFEDPVRALSHLRAMTEPGGAFAFVCWRGIEENGWNAIPIDAVMPLLPNKPPPPDPDAPGPAAFANKERTHGLLTDAGWRAITIEPWDGEIVVGPTVAEAADFAANIGVARLTAGLNIDRAEIVRRIAEKMAPLASADGAVRAQAACWIVTARA